MNESDLLVLAVKPKDVEKVLKNIRHSVVPNRHLLVSIAAGIRTTTIEQVCCDSNNIQRYTFYLRYFNQKVE